MRRWSAYAAAVWAFVFAAMSFYWALGGTIGAETLGSAFTDPALRDDPVFMAFLWGTAFLKLLIGVLALALIQPWGERFPRRWLRGMLGLTGLLLALYGAALLIEHGLMAAGARAIPVSVGSMEAVHWHLFLWDPYWLIGGVLFLLAARFAQNRATLG